MRPIPRQIILRIFGALGYEVRQKLPYTDKANDHDIFYCYRLLYGREPDEGETNRMRSWISTGVSLSDLVSLFVDHPDFRNAQGRRALAYRESELIDLPDFKLWISRADFLIGQNIKRNRSYEPHVAAALRQRLHPGMTFVDVGANIGFHTMLAAFLVGNGGSVYSFEPNLFDCSLLLRSAAENGFTNIEVFPFAAADTERIMIYDDIGGSNGKVGELDSEVGPVSGRVLTRSVTLDSILYGRKVDLIKADIEGAEYLALQGARGIIERDRPVIVSELSEQLVGVSKVSVAEYLQMLVDMRYSLSILKADCTVEECGRSTRAVHEAWERSPAAMLDIMAVPSDAALN